MVFIGIRTGQLRSSPFHSDKTRRTASSFKIAPRESIRTKKRHLWEIFLVFFAKERKREREVYLNYTFHISSPRRRFSFLGFEIRLLLLPRTLQHSWEWGLQSSPLHNECDSLRGDLWIAQISTPLPSLYIRENLIDPVHRANIST